MGRRGITAVAASALLAMTLLASVQVPAVQAFSADTHYYLTYCLCRSCGFSAEQARIIASADLSVDGGGTDTGFLYLLNNQLWHGLSVPALNDLREGCLWERAVAMADPQSPAGSDAGLIAFGQFLHFQQDRHAHESYFLAPVWGHFYDGYMTDWLAFRPGSSRAMAEASLSYIAAFAAIYGLSNSTEVSLDLLIGGLISANPSPSFWSTSSSGAASSVVESYLGEFLPAPIAFTFSHQGEAVPPSRYPQIPLFSYLQLLYEQFLLWHALW